MSQHTPSSGDSVQTGWSTPLSNLQAALDYYADVPDDVTVVDINDMSALRWGDLRDLVRDALISALLAGRNAIELAAFNDDSTARDTGPAGVHYIEAAAILTQQMRGLPPRRTQTGETR